MAFRSRTSPPEEYADPVARAFHEAYERLAPIFGWTTQEASRKEWEDVPENNRALMVAVARELLGLGVISPGESLTTCGGCAGGLVTSEPQSPAKSGREAW